MTILHSPSVKACQYPLYGGYGHARTGDYLLKRKGLRARRLCFHCAMRYAVIFGLPFPKQESPSMP